MLRLTKMTNVSPHTHFTPLLQPVVLFPFSTGHLTYSQLQATKQCTWKGYLARRGVSIPKETLLLSAGRTFQLVHQESERASPNTAESLPRCLQRDRQLGYRSRSDRHSAKFRNILKTLPQILQ